MVLLTEGACPVIRLGKLTDYAIVLLVQLAREGEGASRSATWLAEKTGLPEPTVAKVLKNLSRENLVTSVRGAQGGYRLGQPPAALSVGGIIEAVEGPIALVACVEGNNDPCHAEARCPTKGKWDPINSAVRTALHGVTLADMMAQQQAGMCGGGIRPAPVMPTMPEARPEVRKA